MKAHFVCLILLFLFHFYNFLLFSTTTVPLCCCIPFSLLLLSNSLRLLYRAARTPCLAPLQVIICSTIDFVLVCSIDMRYESE